MSAELLREAAEKMRQRAEAATPGHWATQRGARQLVYGDPEQGRFVADTGYTGPIDDRPIPDAEHIASWHPAVAMAVADLLDRQAAFIEAGGDFTDFEAGGDASALAVARAYLGAGSTQP